VQLTLDGDIAAFDEYPVGAWRVRFANKARLITYAQGSGVTVQLDTTMGDPDLGPDVAEYLATPPTVVDTYGAPLAASGLIPLTAE